MEKEIRDALFKIEVLSSKLTQQDADATKRDLGAIHGILNGLIRSAQDADDCDEDH